MEIGSIKAGPQSGLKDIAIIADTKRQVGSRHRSVIICFTISWELFWLPCINNMKTRILNYRKVAV